MLNLKSYEVWFITGSQHLYGLETLKQVAANSQQIANALDAAASFQRSVLRLKKGLMM